VSSSTRAQLKSHLRGISLGLYAADLGHLADAAIRAGDWGCDILHFDVMDGVFVPQMTAGAGFVSALSTGALRDVHLMVEDAARAVDSYLDAGADLITVHAESKGAVAAISAIQAAPRAVLAGLALMPGTSLEAAKPLLDLGPDLILVLSLDPRDGAKADIPAACRRLSDLRALTQESAPLLAFDGGVTLDSIEEIAACRPDMVVSGSAILKATDPARAFARMAASLTEQVPPGAAT